MLACTFKMHRFTPGVWEADWWPGVHVVALASSGWADCPSNPDNAPQRCARSLSIQLLFATTHPGDQGM